MNDFGNLEKIIVRELSCRLCLCTDVVKLKPLSNEIKRKLKRLFDITVRADDNLPKAICHDCLQQVSSLHLYAVKVEKTQKFLEFHKQKSKGEKQDGTTNKMTPLIGALSVEDLKQSNKISETAKSSPSPERQHGDTKISKQKPVQPVVKKSPLDMKLMEAMSLDEFAITEKVDKNLLGTSPKNRLSPVIRTKIVKQNNPKAEHLEIGNSTLDPVVLIDGKPAKQGSALDKQITLFYKMECCVCHESGFNFRSLMKHYKDRHGVPGYVTCCEKKFHYFYPKKIIEHMAYHLQPNIFMCPSCHHNFQTSQELSEHQSNGGRSEGKIICPRCTERYPTYRELGCHIITHRTERLQCDYCGKFLKHHHRKKTINHMEDVILCSQCTRSLKNIDKQEKENKDKTKAKISEATLQKYQKFRQAMGLSGDEDGSTD